MFEKWFTEDEIDAALVDAAIENYVQGGMNPYYARKGWNCVREMQLGETFETRLGRMSVLKNSFDYDDYDSSPQGGSDFMIVLQVDRDGRYFSKEGHVDSYGSVEWASGMHVVEGKTKTITVFE